MGYLLNCVFLKVVSFSILDQHTVFAIVLKFLCIFIFSNELCHLIQHFYMICFEFTMDSLVITTICPTKTLCFILIICLCFKCVSSDILINYILNT